MTRDEYRARVIDNTACPLCVASPGEDCWEDVNEDGQRWAVEYVHDDRSHAHLEAVFKAVGVGPAAWPEIEARMKDQT